MQHLDSKYREEDVADEVQIEDLLQRRTKKLAMESVAGLAWNTHKTKKSLFRHQNKTINLLVFA